MFRVFMNDPLECMHPNFILHKLLPLGQHKKDTKQSIRSILYHIYTNITHIGVCKYKIMNKTTLTLNDVNIENA